MSIIAIDAALGTSTTSINIIDAVMGAGKTQYVIKMIGDRHKHEEYEYTINTGGEDYTYSPSRRKWLIVVPFKSEVKRFKDELSTLYLHDPEPVHGHKLYHLAILIKEGLNVVCTHALFELLTPELYKDLKQQNYTLVIDETLDCVDEYKFNRHDLNLLRENKWITPDPVTKRLVWNDEIYKVSSDRKGAFAEIKSLCDTGSLVLVNDIVLLWEFPIEFIKCFNEIWLCTYMFMGSPFFSYLMSYDFDMNFLTINGNGDCVPWQGSGLDETALKTKFRSLITLYEGGTAANLIREGRENPYSMGWFRRQGDDAFKMIKASTRNFFENVAKTTSTENGWTVWKEFKSKCEGQGYTKTRNPYQENDKAKTRKIPPPKDKDGRIIEGLAYGFIAANAKGSNNWMNVKSMAYLCNTFYHTMIRQYFVEKQIPVYDELYALSEMIQWIWRSRIRNGEPIHLYIPSERMRNLFKMWLDSNSLEELLTEKLYPQGHSHHAPLKLLFSDDADLKDAA